MLVNVLSDVRSTKIQISLRMRSDRSEFVVCMKKFCILGYPKMCLLKTQMRLNPQADLNLRRAYMSEGMFTGVSDN